MSTAPWMPFNVDDYMADTLHLSAAEHGAYMLLIMRYWKDGGLPADERMIQRFSRLTPEQWAESRDVLAAFFEDGWRHKRVDAELAKATDIIEKRRAAASTKHADSKSSAHAVHVDSKSSDTRVPHRTKNLSSPSLRSGDGRARRLEADEPLPDSFREDASEIGLPADRHDAEWRTMRDWSLSAKDGARRDWRAMWRNWCRRRLGEQPPQSGAGPPRRGNPVLDALNALPREIHDRPRPAEVVVLNVPALAQR